MQKNYKLPRSRSPTFKNIRTGKTVKVYSIGEKTAIVYKGRSKKTLAFVSARNLRRV